jgi:hypothetical protein
MGAPIALVDCNNFYVSCERVFQPWLPGKPVVVLDRARGALGALAPEFLGGIDQVGRHDGSIYRVSAMPATIGAFCGTNVAAARFRGNSAKGEATSWAAEFYSGYWVYRFRSSSSSPSFLTDAASR